MANEAEIFEELKQFNVETAHLNKNNAVILKRAFCSLLDLANNRGFAVYYYIPKGTILVRTCNSNSNAGRGSCVNFFL